MLSYRRHGRLVKIGMKAMKATRRATCSVFVNGVCLGCALLYDIMGSQSEHVYQHSSLGRGAWAPLRRKRPVMGQCRGEERKKEREEAVQNIVQSSSHQIEQHPTVHSLKSFKILDHQSPDLGLLMH